MNNFTRGVRAHCLRSLRSAGFALFIFLFAIAPAAFAGKYTDLWWNKDESGWGMTVAHHEDKVFAVWYVYDSDRHPLWVVMPDGSFGADGHSVTGTLYRTSGPSYRDAAFSPPAVSRDVVGSARIDFAADDTSATVSYSVGSISATKKVARQPFGNAPANHPDDYSDLWWTPEESGWGLALTHHGDTVFGVWYTYDQDHRPLWVVLPAGRFTSATTFGGKLYTTTGSPFSAAFDPASVKLTEVGDAVVTFSGDVGTFSSNVNGWVQHKRIVRQSFGKPAATNARPTLKLEVSTPSPLVAPATITLKATAADADGRVVEVAFFAACERLGSVASAPYQWVVANLAPGTYVFSARATDDKGASVQVTSTPIEVKGSASANKPPRVSIATPAANAVFQQGEMVELTASASDPDGSVVKVEYFANQQRVGEASTSPWRVQWSGAVAGNYTLTATATDNQGATGASASVAIGIAPPPVVLDEATRDAARFLAQATFGIHGTADVDALKARGYEGWLADQFAMNAASHVQYVNDRKAAGEGPAEERAYEAIWQQWLWEPGQLRGRMAFALSEIVVISNVAPDLDTYAMASYMDLLNRNAFGNYRQLLEEVTLHPAMGHYLNMIGSKKADAAKGTHPNENYAREVMQLFTIGLYKLNADGTRTLDPQGKPVPTYDQNAVLGMAAAFSGWNFAGNDTSNAAVFNPAKADWLDPMVPWEMWHDTNAKTLFDGITLPAGQGARQDLKGALDALFNHPNVGPFVGRELIQRFVTSNPSPAYIGRVAGAFNDNGQGVRGDLKAVIRAVLLDPEARSLAKAAEPMWGKQREPVVRFANFLRGLNATSPSGRNRIWYLDSADEGLNQSPLLAPSVFNFFSPNYKQPGPLSAAGLVAPEFQITTETSMVGGLNFFARLVRNGAYGSDDTRLTLNLAELNALANNPPALADRLNLLLLCGAMSAELRATIVATLNALPAAKTGGTVTDRVKAALILVAISPDFAIQK